MGLPTANKRGDKKGLVVRLNMDWLLFDIMNETFLRGRTIQNRDNHKQVASMFASMDDENREKIMRTIKRSYGELKSELSDYLDEKVFSTDNGHITPETNLELHLEMPSNFNEAASQAVNDACHAFIVHESVAEWYVVTNKDEAAEYFTLARNDLELVRYTSSKRARPEVPLG